MIIDDKGAENLMKHGDMLYKMDSGTERIRAQGYYIETDEVESIVNDVMQINGLEVYCGMTDSGGRFVIGYIHDFYFTFSGRNISDEVIIDCITSFSNLPAI